MSAGADLILDAALKEPGQDRFDHEAIAGVVADLALNATPPVNIALFGPWGSGKSSFFGLLKDRLDASDQSVKVATYDAWKYGGRALKKHFVGSVAEQLGLGGDDFDERLAHGQEDSKLDLWSWAWGNKGSLAIGAVMAIVFALVWFLLVSVAIWIVNWDAGFGKATQVAVTTLGTVLSLGFAALLFGPRILESAVVKVKEAAPETDDEFARSFQRLVARAIKLDKGDRLVVFIDELDRCSPKDVVATLIDLKTFLDVNGCVFVVAADREVLERSLREVPQANPVRDEDPYYSTPGAFLDKIFQHQIPLPPLRPQALTRFARELVEAQGGLWADLRAAQEDERLFLRVVYGLVPVHVRSPRRVKVLLNNYATNVRIAQSRGVSWLRRAEELAVLTVLETEFPAVASDLIRFPSLLRYLRDPGLTARSKNARTIVESYFNLLKERGTPGADDATGSPVAGDLLVDDDKAAGRRANKVLVENLLTYLRKIEASGIDDPKPDLLYLQSAGAQEGIDDPDLAEVIDFAADYSALDVVVKFADQPSAVVATAIRLLSQQADAERGPGRLAITESVCRLTEQLDAADAQAIAPLVAGSVLAESGNPDWPTDATPGALILGVIGASKPLVEALLTSQSADVMAKAGVLGRIASVLMYASEEQAELVYDLLRSAYYLHPEPLHDAIRTTPAEVARELWNNVEVTVTEALTKLAQQADPAQLASSGDAAPAETAVERFGALLTAAESRTDGESEHIISNVLRLGQGSSDNDLRKSASDRAEEALDRIADTAAVNVHAMLGLRYSPLEEAAWWAERLSEAVPAPDGYMVFERLVDALATSEGEGTDTLAAAIPAVIPHVPEDELSDAQHWIAVALGRTPWAILGTATARNRAALYAVAAAVRPRLTDEDTETLDFAIAADLVGGLAVSNEEVHGNEQRSLVKNVPEPVAVEVEHLAVGRTLTPADTVPTLRLRIAAAGRGSGGVIASADVLAAKGLDGDKLAFGDWLMLNPTMPEALQVLGKIAVSITALDTYAKGLNIEDRTTLWIDLAGREENWSQAAFRAVGKHGLSSEAVKFAAKEISASPNQNRRDVLIDRLEAATLIEQPQHRAATDLVLQLLDTGVGGDIALAARVAVHTGGAAYGKTVQVREAFDAVVAAKPKSLTKAQQLRLQSIKLMSEPKRSKGLLGRLGGQSKRP
ncbi:P-loop NTPase fold protein [Nocardioides sp. NPDC051685]|uniref:KAP family P-loop NTPase fold protein n=1 Tax=Nocardioides sp. NPDC051685 TaxID=3364334 RepID=UPI00378B4D9E